VSDDRNEPSISARASGPFVVRGLPVVRKRPVESELGEPLTWQVGDRVEVSATVLLCRCGASSTKPLCDGAHASIGFDGTDGTSDDTYAERAKPYDGGHLQVRDDRSICMHAGFCGSAATNVWKQVKHTEDTTIRAQVINMIERCPSGALTYRLEAEGDDVEPDLPRQVALVDDGPLWVTGGVPVQRADGTDLEVRARVTLCRCGASARKPLCDGSHKEAGFTDH